MGIIVQKYGGTSLAGSERIKKVASRIVTTKKQGHNVVAVVSAVGDTTDNLLKQAHEIAPAPPKRELDMLLATGEQIAISLLAIAISELGCEAISFTGAQVGIVTDTAYTKARIVSVRVQRVINEINKGKIVIVAGFQGATKNNDITTLGRGGSDMTAVALAAELNADICQIYTDVEGVYTADPRLEPKARKLEVVSYEEMLELAATGANVLQLRSVEYGRNHHVLIEVRSRFSDTPGTLIKEDVQVMEKAIISGVTCEKEEAKITIFGVPDRPGIAVKVFKALADEGVNVDMILQNVSDKGITDITFTAPRRDLPICRRVVDGVVDELKARGKSYDEEIAKVSLVGAGMKSHPGIAAHMFEILSDNGINIEMISTSSIKVSCVIREKDVVSAVQAIHRGFELDKEPIK